MEGESSTSDDESYCYCNSIGSSDNSESENEDTMDHEEQYLGFNMVDKAEAESRMQEDKNIQSSDNATSSEQGTLEDHIGNSWHRSDSEGMSLSDYEEGRDESIIEEESDYTVHSIRNIASYQATRATEMDNDMEDGHISNNFFSYPDSQKVNMAKIQEATKDDDNGNQDTENTVNEMHLERDYPFVHPTIKKESKPRPFKAKIPKFEIDKIIPKMGWLPEETVKQTLLHTTQLVPRMSMSVPMRRHFRARAPELNQK
jgi:hypothetical protein